MAKTAVLGNVGGWCPGTWAVFKREFFGYFRTPLAYVFLAAFLVLSTALPWYLGNLFDRNQANLDIFFYFLPFVYVLLIPAVGMRLWSEERKSGTWELLFTMPLGVGQAVVGKFLAAWAFVAIAILLTFTMPLTVEYLGDPDWGPIFAGYFGAVLMAGAYLGICAVVSASTETQVISFVLSLFIVLVLVLLGVEFLGEAMINAGFPVWLKDAISNFSFVTHFDMMSKGLIDFGDVVFFLSLAAFGVLLNIVVLER